MAPRPTRIDSQRPTAFDSGFRETASSTVGGRKWTVLDTFLTFITGGIWLLIYLLIRNNNKSETVRPLDGRAQSQAPPLGPPPSTFSNPRTGQPFYWEQTRGTTRDPAAPTDQQRPESPTASTTSAAPASSTQPSQDLDEEVLVSNILSQIEKVSTALRKDPKLEMVEQTQSFLETLMEEHNDLIERNPALKTAVTQLVSLLQSIHDPEERKFVQQLCQKILLRLKPENFSAEGAKGILRLLEGKQSFLVTKYPELLSEPVRRLRVAVQSSQSA